MPTAQSQALNAMMGHLPSKLYMGQNDGERIYLSRPSFDCDWYWGFGYLGNKNRHYHLKGIAGGKNVHLRDAVLAHFGDSFVVKDAVDVWKFCEISLTIYQLKETAQLFHLAGTNTTLNPDADMLRKPEWVDEINNVLIPRQIEELYKILLKYA